jgi:hypothetical protein
VADRCGADREGLADAIGHVAEYATATMLGRLVELAGHLHPAGWWRPDPAALFDDDLVDALRAEAEPVVTVDAPVLVMLCGSAPVTDAVSRAAGRPLLPTLHAAYQFDEDLPVHLDREEFPFVLHVVVDHQIPDGTTGSHLLVHTTGGVERVAVGVGEGLVLAGRGTLHRWEPLAEDEHRTMIAIGYADRDGA